MLKRGLDICVSLGAFIVAAPLCVLIAIAIKLDSPGPVLFRQDRVGFRARQFQILKFRSMSVNSPCYARSPATRTDPRITRVGRVLRRFSLDELPQFANILRGEMSLVGPRPEMPFIVRQYTRQQRRRLEAPPGLTGLWQISAARAFPIHENIAYDLHYIEHASLWLDAAILWRTLGAVCRGAGAL